MKVAHGLALYVYRCLSFNGRCRGSRAAETKVKRPLHLRLITLNERPPETTLNHPKNSNLSRSSALKPLDSKWPARPPCILLHLLKPPPFHHSLTPLPLILKIPKVPPPPLQRANRVADAKSPFQLSSSCCYFFFFLSFFSFTHTAE